MSPPPRWSWRRWPWVWRAPALPRALASRCPFALPEDVKVYLDVSMKRFETVFPAAGSSNSAVEMTCDELERYASNFAAWVDVCKGWRPEEQG